MSDSPDKQPGSQLGCAACATNRDTAIRTQARQSPPSRAVRSPRELVRLIAGTLCLFGLPACAGSAHDRADEQAVQLISTDPVCKSQRAVVPNSGMITLRFAPEPAQVQRTDMSPTYIAYAARTKEALLYVSFTGSLPKTISTADARAAFKYAYVGYDYQQPAAYGGSLSLLSTNDLLALDDFERFEVVAGALSFRLVRRSGTQYAKLLSLYDEDDTNDPLDAESCTGGGDIQGRCSCEFSGPSIQVTLEGALPL